MYFNSGYLNNSRLDFKDYSKPLVVGSCGTYRLKNALSYLLFGQRVAETIKSSMWHLVKHTSGSRVLREVVTSGHMVLYQPKEIQKYVYYVEDHPEVFWIHFTGYDVKNILNYRGIPLDKHVFTAAHCRITKCCSERSSGNCSNVNMAMKTILLRSSASFCFLVSRKQQESEKTTTSIPEEIEAAVAYFNENYNTKVSVDDYAESLHISTNWFIRNFKQYMKISPAQYILSLRMVNAQSLLESTEYNIGEIAEIVGYDNPLYFSRVFKKEYGVSPAQYRKNLEGSTEK